VIGVKNKDLVKAENYNFFNDNSERQFTFRLIFTGFKVSIYQFTTKRI